MSVLSLKPHKIQLYKAGQSYRKENGDLVNEQPVFQFEEPCDVVSSGKASERQFEDGKRKTYSYTIYLDKNCKDYHIGDHVRLILNTGAEYDFIVLGFVRYQMQAKLWV